jgi:4-amino-4-deoxy-L-arabinose transferase-like glycosyltransferase
MSKKELVKSKTNWLDPIALTLIGIALVVCFQIRLHGIYNEHDRTFDEGLYVWMALHLVEEPDDYSAKGYHKANIEAGFTFEESATDYLTQPLFKHPPFFVSLMKFFAPSRGPARRIVAVAPLLGCLAILIAYLYTRKAYGSLAGYLAGIFLILDPNLWINSQKVWMETTLAAFIMMSVFSFFLALEASSRWRLTWFIVTGLSIGLAANTKYIGLVPLAGFFLYIVLYDRGLLKEARIWTIPGVAILCLAPWILKNISVYGVQGFLSSLVNIIGSAGDLEKTVLRIGGGLFIALLAGAAIAFKFKRPEAKETSSHPKRGMLIYTVVGLIFIGSLLLQESFLKSMMRMVHPSIIPTTSFEVGFFSQEPWNFYFGRFIELSPYYLLAYFFLLLPLIKKGLFSKADLILLVQTVLFLTVLSIWGSYQSRYALPATVMLLIMASRVASLIWESSSQLKGMPARVLQTGWILLLFLGGIKTLLVDLRFVMPNNMAYY